jgi:hypothetical protein
VLFFSFPMRRWVLSFSLRFSFPPAPRHTSEPSQARRPSLRRRLPLRLWDSDGGARAGPRRRSGGAPARASPRRRPPHRPGARNPPAGARRRGATHILGRVYLFQSQASSPTHH